MPKKALTLESLLAQDQELPSLPEIYIRVSEQLENDKVTAQQIGDTVQTDPAISSRLLTMVNSAYYGLPHRVSSIAQAISLLGRLRLKHILIGSVLGGMFRGIKSDAFSMQEFWEHSIKTAIIARQLAIRSPDISEPEELFSAGLLHDIGRLILANMMPDQLIEAEQLEVSKRIDTIQAETEVMGFDHTMVSVGLMQHWGFPEVLRECARNHHQVEHTGEHAAASRIIYLANRLSQNVPPMDEDEAIDQLAEIPGWEASNISSEAIFDACHQAEDLVFEVLESLGMVNIEISAE